MKLYVKERLPVLLILVLCLFVTVLRRSDFYGEETETRIGFELSSGPEVIKDIDARTVLKQVFYPQSGILNYIYIGLGGHGQTGSMIVTVYDEASREIATRELPCESMVPQGAQGVSFQIRVTPGKEYFYTVTFRDIEDEYPQIQTARCTDGREIGALYVDGEPGDQCIYGLFVYQQYYTQNVLWRICAAVTALMLLFFLFSPRLPVWRTRLSALLLPGHAFLSVCLLELAAGTPFEGLTARRLFYNTLLCSLLFLVLFLFLWNARVWLTAGTVLCFVIGTAQYYVLQFRGTPLVPSDVFSIGTAMEVGGSYDFSVTPQIFTAFLVMMAVLLIERKVEFCRYTARMRIGVTAGLLLLGGVSLGYLRSRPILNVGKNGGFFWNLTSSYQKYGYFLSTYIYQNFQQIERPEGYSEEALLSLKEEFPGETKEKTIEKQYPNIIVIMNESLADFDSVGGLHTKEPVMPFLDSLTEDTIRGNLYVSVFGGGTANTEFEFLTGSTMNFLPVGSIPYQAYIKDEVPSLASFLKEYDYRTLALHLADRSNWNRDVVYPLLGFDEYISEESEGELERIHGYPSDSENYRKILKQYEAWKEEGGSEHFFCFNITIQNHGGYTYGYRSEKLPALEEGKTEDDVAEYLSLLQASDQAFEELVTYFQNEEEPVLLLMFGDHWPRLNSGFLDSLTNQAEASSALENNQNRYVTPFVLWANYDIEEVQDARLSVNYLQQLLLETAGLPLDGYQTFLSQMSQHVPVINSLGYIDSDGNYADSKEELGEENIRWIEDYQILQYDNLFS